MTYTEHQLEALQHLVAEQTLSLTALSNNLRHSHSECTTISLHLSRQNSKAYQQLTEFFRREIVAVLGDLEQAVRLANNSFNHLQQTLTKHLQQQQLLRAEIARLQLELGQSHAALNAHSAAYGFAIPSNPLQAVASSSTAYTCLADPQTNYDLQTLWEPASRHHNYLAAQHATHTAQLAALQQQITTELTNFHASLTAVQLPPQPREVSAAATPDNLRFAAIDHKNPLLAAEKRLAAGDLDPVALLAVYAALSHRQQRMFISRNKWSLATGSRVPTTLKQEAAHLALQQTLKDPQAAARAMGLPPAAATRLHSEAKTLQTALRQNPEAQLISYGKQQHQSTAQVLVGDPHTAQQLIVLVPGMGSNVGGIGNTLAAAQALRSQLQTHRVKTAVIVWQGYDSPELLEEPLRHKAVAGGVQLRGDIAALQQQYPAAKLSIIGHSYGTTTAAEALKGLDQPVQNFIAVGSAGLRDGTTRQELRAEKIFATTAAPEIASWGDPITYQKQQLLRDLSQHSDLIAPVGIAYGEHRVDPRDLAQVTVLPANHATAAGQRVGTHSLYATAAGEVGYFNPESQSLRAIAGALAASQVQPQDSVRGSPAPQ
ncbi:hypothetical protein EII31_02730 [Leucobacter sp. OH2974_COT-288]|nr:hypothetical protein EII31_02730 [Leucobacter sp. OH2974_COT-288]